MTDREKLTPEERDRLLIEDHRRIKELERREATRSGASAFQKAARDASAIMFFVTLGQGVVRSLWRAAQAWLEAPK